MRGEILDAASKRARVDLFVPFLYPGVGTHRGVNSLKILAGLVILIVLLLASVEVYVALVTVSGLILIRKPRIERRGLQCFLGDFR